VELSDRVDKSSFRQCGFGAIYGSYPN
jgi:hypothetical protein